MLAALERGRQILASGAFVGHRPLRFRPLAAHLKLEMGNLDRALAELDAFAPSRRTSRSP